MPNLLDTNWTRERPLQHGVVTSIEALIAQMRAMPAPRPQSLKRAVAEIAGHYLNT